MMIFCCLNHQKRNLTVVLKESIGDSPVIIHGVAQHNCTSNEKGKLKKVLNMYKENISAAYVSDMEIEEPSPLYVRDTKNKAEELDRLHAAIKEKLVTASNIDFLNTLKFQNI